MTNNCRICGLVASLDQNGVCPRCTYGTWTPWFMVGIVLSVVAAVGYLVLAAIDTLKGM